MRKVTSTSDPCVAADLGNGVAAIRSATWRNVYSTVAIVSSRTRAFGDETNVHTTNGEYHPIEEKESYMSYSAFAAKVSSLNEKYDESTVNAAFNPSNADGWDVRYVRNFGSCEFT